MDNSLRLYRIIMDLIWQNGVRFHDLRIVTTFVWAVVGLILSGQIHLSCWGLYRFGQAKAASKERQLARWLDNPRIVRSLIYRRLIRSALADWEGHRVYLALDSSQLWRRFTVVRVALVYRGRALPVSWIVLASQSATVDLKDYQVILTEAGAVLPKRCQVILLADRGFFRSRSAHPGSQSGLELPHPPEKLLLGLPGEQTPRQSGEADACQRPGALSAQGLDH